MNQAKGRTESDNRSDEQRRWKSLGEHSPVLGADDTTGYEQKARQLENEISPLTPDAGERASLRNRVVACAEEFLRDIDGRPVFVAVNDEGSVLRDSPVSDAPMEPAAGAKRLIRPGNDRSAA